MRWHQTTLGYLSKHCATLLHYVTREFLASYREQISHTQRGASNRATKLDTLCLIESFNARNAQRRDRSLSSSLFLQYKIVKNNAARRERDREKEKKTQSNHDK